MSYKLSHFCWISLAVVFFNSYCFGQKNNQAAPDSVIAPAEENTVTGDFENIADTLVTKSDFDSANDSILKWKQDREFGYMTYLDSLLRKKTGLKIDTVSIDKGTVDKTRAKIVSARSTTSNSFLDSFAVKFFFWAIAFFFIGFILYKLFFTGGLFSNGNAKPDEEHSNKEPEILKEYSAYNLLINEAELKNDFNLCIRYLYLQSLKQLSDRELIVFSPDKTNNRYVTELSGNGYQQEFAFLTRNYEYVWYGKFALDPTRYKTLKGQFILFNTKI